MPRRIIPRNSKPDFPVRTNKTSPFNKHLLYSSVFPKSGFDAADKEKQLAVTPGVTFSHEGLEADGTAGNQLTLSRSLDFSNDEATIILRVRHDSSSNGGVISDKDQANWGSAVGLSLNLRTSGGMLFKIGADEALTDTNYFPSSTDYHDVVIRWQGGVLVEMYVDGVEVSYSGTPGVAASHATASISTRIGVYFWDQADASLNGTIKYMHVFNKLLPLGYIENIRKNPYQLLQPRTQYIGLGEAAPTGRIMGSLAANGGLAGQGGIAGIGGGLAG